MGAKKNRDNVKTLGWVAFFGGFSQDMIQPVLPIFYTSVLGLNKRTIGLIEGSLTTIVSVFKILSGVLSDKLRRRKPLVFIGYLLSAVSRFSFSFITRGWQAFGLRLADGVGKGTKDAPRDALVAGSAKRSRTGFSFGYQRMLDTFGSVLGPLAAYWMLSHLFSGGLKYRAVFFVSGITALMTILLVGLLVKEDRSQSIGGQPQGFGFDLLKGRFALFLLIMLVFTLGNSSDAFLILRARNVGVNPVVIPIVYAMFNLFYAALSLPAGSLSDKVGRVKVMQLGWAIYALAYLGFALARQPWHIWALYAFYGLFYATTEGVAKSLVAHVVKDQDRGIAYGLFNASLGLMSLPASLIAGFLWDKVSPAAPFYFGSGCAFIALICLSVSGIERREPSTSGRME